MSGFYDIVTKLYDSVSNDSLVNQTTKGDLASVLNNKQNLFPLCHIMVNSSTFDKQILVFNISIILSILYLNIALFLVKISIII